MNVTHWISPRRPLVVGATVLAVGLLVGPTAVSAGIVKVKAKPAGCVWVPPMYETRARVVTVPAVYETCPRRIWHKPVYELRRVLVKQPTRVIVRRVPRYSWRTRLIGCTTVKTVAAPPRRVWKTKRVLVRAGYYETVYERVYVTPATTRTVYEKVLVRLGHWGRPKCATVHSHPAYVYTAAAQPYGGVHVAVQLGALVD